MESKTLSNLIIRLTGLCLIVATLQVLPIRLSHAITIATQFEHHSLAEYIPLAGALAVSLIGIALIRFPAVIASKVLGIAASDDQTALPGDTLERVALSVLGAYLFVNGIADLSYTLCKVFLYNHLDRQMQFGDATRFMSSDIGGIASSIVQTIAGSVLSLRSRGLVALLRSLRG